MLDALLAVAAVTTLAMAVLQAGAPSLALPAGNRTITSYWSLADAVLAAEHIKWRNLDNPNGTPFETGLETLTVALGRKIHVVFISREVSQECSSLKQITVTVSATGDCASGKDFIYRSGTAIYDPFE